MVWHGQSLILYELLSVLNIWFYFEPISVDVASVWSELLFLPIIKPYIHQYWFSTIVWSSVAWRMSVLTWSVSNNIPIPIIWFDVHRFQIVRNKLNYYYFWTFYSVFCWAFKDFVTVLENSPLCDQVKRNRLSGNFASVLRYDI